MPTSPLPCGISHRTQWMQAYIPCRDAAVTAYLAYQDSKSLLHPPKADGMPHGTSKSDPVANCVERSNKARYKWLRAKDRWDISRKKRLQAMQSLSPEQKKVLALVYFCGKSRRQTAEILHKSDFWVRAQERTGLFMLELPTDWYLEIIP